MNSMGAQRAILLRSACQRALYSCRLGFVSSSPAPFPMTSLQACLLEVSAKQAVLSNHLAPAGKCDNKCPEGLKNCHDNCNENYVSCQLNIGGVIGEICLLLGPVTAVEPTSMLICACITSIGAPSVAGPNVLGHIRLKSNLLHSDRHTTKRCLGGILLLANRTRL